MLSRTGAPRPRVLVAFVVSVVAWGCGGDETKAPQGQRAPVRAMKVSAVEDGLALATRAVGGRETATLVTAAGERPIRLPVKHGIDASFPCGQLICVASGGTLTGIGRDGVSRWSRALDGAWQKRPALTRSPDTLYLIAPDAGLLAVDIPTGQTRWSNTEWRVGAVVGSGAELHVALRDQSSVVRVDPKNGAAVGIGSGQCTTGQRLVKPPGAPPRSWCGEHGDTVLAFGAEPPRHGATSFVGVDAKAQSVKWAQIIDGTLISPAEVDRYGSGGDYVGRLPRHALVPLRRGSGLVLVAVDLTTGRTAGETVPLPTDTAFARRGDQTVIFVEEVAAAQVAELFVVFDGAAGRLVTELRATPGMGASIDWLAGGKLWSVQRAKDFSVAAKAVAPGPVSERGAARIWVESGR